MAIQFIIARKIWSVQSIDGVNESFEAVSQIGDIRAPIEVSGQVTEGYSETGEHHHWNGKRWP